MPPSTRHFTQSNASRTLGSSLLRLGIFAASTTTTGALSAAFVLAASLDTNDLWGRFLEKAFDQGAALMATEAGTKIIAPLAKALTKRWQETDATFAQPELSACLGAAITEVLLELARDTQIIPGEEDRRTLLNLAKQTPRRWARIAAFPRTAHLNRKQLQGAIGGHLTSALQGGAAGPLDADAWAPILTRLLSASFELSDGAFAATTEGLAALTGTRFLKLLQNDAASGGQRFAAGMFASIGQIQKQLTEEFPADLAKHFNNEVLPVIEGITEQLCSVTRQLGAMKSEAGWRHRTVIRRLRKLDDKLSGKLDGILGALTAELPLDERPPKPSTAQTLTQVFRAQQRAIPLLGRDRELAHLEAWLDGERRVAIDLLTGKAGTGKTRLAQDLCDAVRGEGWHAGFIGSAQLDRFLKDVASNWTWSQPTLVVIDYAAPRCKQIGQLLDLIESRRTSTGPHIRVLLLERYRGQDEAPLPLLLRDLSIASHQDQNDWYERNDDIDLIGFRSQPEILLQILTASLISAEETSLDPEEPATARPTDTALVEIAKRLAEALPVLRLDESTPLLLQLAVRYRKGIVGAGSQGRAINSLPDLLREWWAEEHRLMARLAKAEGIDPSVLQTLVVLACLRGGLPSDPGKLHALAVEECKRWHCEAPPAGARLERILTSFLGPAPPSEDPDSDPLIPALEPDLMAEYAVLDRFQRASQTANAPTQLRNWLAHHARAREIQVGAFLVRLCADLYDARDDKNPSAPPAWHFLVYDQPTASSHTPTDWWHTQAIPTLLAAEYSLPRSTVALLELKLRICLALHKHEQQPSPAEKIRRLNNLSIALSNLGRNEDAFRTADDANKTAKQQLKSDSDTARSTHATCLNNLGNMLLKLGHHEKALLVVSQAVDIRRRLAKTRPSAFEPDFARALHSLGTVLSELGRQEEALKATQQVINIRQRFAEAEFDYNGPSLGGAFNNLGLSLAALGRRKEALKATQQAAEIFKPLAMERPDAFDPGLAMALSNLGMRLFEHGRPYAALNAANEALEINRKLAARQSDVFVPTLAGNLGTMGDILEQLRNPEGAAAVFEEALRLLLPLIERHPGTHARLATALRQGLIGNCKNAELDPDPRLLVALDKFIPEKAEP